MYGTIQPQEQLDKTKEKLYNVSVIVTSDSCFEDETKDTSGPQVVKQLRESPQLFANVTKRCVPDDKAIIIASIEDSLRNEDPALIITIGGTGLCPRDVTPEATSSLYEKPCSGIVSALHMTSLRYTPHAALSRLTAGIVRQTLIVNFPGSVRACQDCLSCLMGFIKHALEQVRFNAESYNATHLKMQHKDIHQRAYPAILKTPNGQNKENGTKAATNKFRRFVPSTIRPQSTQARNKTNSAPAQNKKPNGSRLDSRSSRLSIREVLESRVEHFESNSTQKVSQPSNSSDLNAQIAGVSIEDSPPKLELTKVPKSESSYPMIDFAKAHEIMGTLSYNLLDESDEISLVSFVKAYTCIGKILADDIAPKCLIPPYSVSTMDGYVLNVPQAVKNAIGSTKTLPPVKVCDSMKTFEEFQKDPTWSQTFFCYQVNTGGKLPANNFAVIPFEKTSRCPDESFVYINEVKPGLYVRGAGSDVGPKDVLKAGTIIGPVELSMIMAMQHKIVKILKRPTIGVLSTGDELINFFKSNDLNEGAVVDTNGPLLASLFRIKGYKVLSFDIVKDDPNAILVAVNDCLKKCEVLLITGGASMGTCDYVKDVIEHMGGTIHFGRVNLKPGKPASFASISLDGKRRFIFSLPGNPVSAYVTSLVLVLPFLEHAIESHFKAEVPVTLDCIGELIDVKVDNLTDLKEPYTFDGRLEFIRAKISKTQEKNDGSDKWAPYLATVSLRQQSSCMISLMDCNCLIMIDPSLKGNKLTVGQVYPALKLHKKI